MAFISSWVMKEPWQSSLWVFKATGDDNNVTEEAKSSATELQVCQPQTRVQIFNLSWWNLQTIACYKEQLLHCHVVARQQANTNPCTITAWMKRHSSSVRSFLISCCVYLQSHVTSAINRLRLYHKRIRCSFFPLSIPRQPPPAALYRSLTSTLFRISI